MSENLKRFFYYWRLPIYFAVLFFIFLPIGGFVDGSVGTFFSVLWLFDCMFFIFFFARSIFIRVRDLIHELRTGERVEEYSFLEIDLILTVYYWIDDDIYTLKKLSTGYLLRCLLLRVSGTALIVVGIIWCFYGYPSYLIITIGTLIMIAGATFWVISNPYKYNSQVEGARMIPGRRGLTEKMIYDYLLYMPTSLGTPMFANVLGFKKPVMVYGAKDEECVYIVYKSKFTQTFYVSAISPYTVESELPVNREDGTCSIPAENNEFGYYMDEICKAVENAVGGTFVWK